MRIFLALVVVVAACSACAERRADTSSKSSNGGHPLSNETPGTKPSVMKRVNLPHFTPLPHPTVAAAPVGSDTGVAETNP